MYSLVRGYSRVSVGAGRLALIDNATLNATPLNKVNATFRGLVLILIHPTKPTQELRYDFGLLGATAFGKFNQSKTFAEWLVWLGNTALATSTESVMVTKRSYVADIFEAGFKIDITVQSGVPADDLIKQAQRDLFVTHPTLKPEVMAAGCIASVNGFLHRGYHSSAAWYIAEGGRTLMKSNDNKASVISFANLGGCTTIPITEGMLQGLPADGEKLRTPIYVKTPDFDWTNKTAFLSLGGYFLPLGKTFKHVGDKFFELNLLQYPLLAHFFESEKVMDLTAIRAVMTKRLDNNQVLATDETFMSPFLKAYLTMSQSFIIAVNSPEVFVDYSDVETTATPGNYLTGLVPDGLLLAETGRILDYIINEDGDRYSLISSTGLRDNHLYHHAPWMLLNTVDPRTVGSAQKTVLKARMAFIGRDTFAAPVV